MKTYCVYYENVFNGVTERHCAWANSYEEAKKKEAYIKNDLTVTVTEIINA